MDDAVRQALARWPDVPDCFGWLSLSQRGEWQLPDGPIRHAGLAAFIGRNYEADAAGQWFFQNGPQRVYVELETAPWIWRLHSTEQGVKLRSHTDQLLDPRDVQQAVMDEDGRLYLALPQGLGMVHSLDMLDAVTALERGELPEVQERQSAQLALQFGYVLSPESLQK